MVQPLFRANNRGRARFSTGFFDDELTAAAMGVTAGTVEASKGIVVGTNKEIDTLVIADGGLKLGSGAGTAVLATAAELNRVADVSTRIVTLVASGAISVATHEGKTLLLGEVGGNALCAMTLPAATASGAKFLFKVSVVNTSSYTITTDGTDVFNGTVETHDLDITDGTLLHAFPATTQTILTLNGTTTGGALIGDWVEIEDILTGKWAIRGVVSCAAGSNPATCFS
jgi:hypothetical protein